ncbi:MAG: hypothetical protein NTY69_08670 [Methylococcales bacterium]|nr:hypothetical protein [Methylococcales bacterium]
MQFINTNTLKNQQNLTLIVIAIILIVSSQSSKAQPYETIQTELKNCQFLKDIEGKSGFGKNYNWKVLAKHSALKKAEEIGASHIVWKEFSSIGAFNGTATAKAYQCNS